ncbi:MAG TPA: serine/threonine-protein kinase [Polyangiaceae bacterium]|nr:serine/threonine-protein kinase [Polyangiaceae bacterium]HNZ21313.1 serine/threonine-protein kinase [Polyangiaceae bacterium]HOD21002.1 serine/threonine-protein kinase [Polyangiaceae bacterium]HOE47512.1 serine/threonine-protein kinase [Polyangiaceae bacterium]HOG99493.1 serine/threonine-protein kinase [Polyangiaceae bacterium]
MTHERSTEEIQDAALGESLEGKIVAERYRVMRLLGEGGMGAVYQAEHVHIRKTVALKVLHKQMCSVPEVVARFEREAVAAGRIEHQNVAVATDFGRLQDGSFFLVLEYAAGRSLRALLQAAGVLEPRRCAHISRQIADALAAAHALAIVHRDLKPDNIMLIERDGDSDFVKVLDFGIAKVSLTDMADQPALTRIGAVFGTPDYMSPEQALGQPVDARSDLYALGILMFEMLMGSTPFEHDDPAMVLAHQVTVPAPRLPDHVPSPLASLVMALLEKDVMQRPQSAVEVVQALDRFLRGEASEPDLSGGLSLHGAPIPDKLPSAYGATALDLGKRPDPESSGQVSAVSRLGRAPVGTRSQSQALRSLLSKLDPGLAAGKTRLPLWGILAAAVALGAVFLLVTTLIAVAVVSKQDAVPVASSGVIPSLSWHPTNMPDPSRSAMRSEIERIESIAVYKRTLDDWVTLARGYSSMDQHRDSALAYRSVLQLDRSRRYDPRLLADLQRAALEPSAFSLVVNLVEGRAGLGETGVDLLWDIWHDLLKHDQPAQAETAFKKLVILSRRASKPLRVAIELHATDRCNKLMEVVSRAEKMADQRSLDRLQHIQSKTECTQEGCYPCLKKSPSLTRAMQRATSHPAPSRDKGYR